MKTITDKEFRAVENSRKQALADLIKRSGQSYAHIAAMTGVGRKAVKRAVECEGIRFDTATRIEYYLEHELNNN